MSCAYKLNIYTRISNYERTLTNVPKREREKSKKVVEMLVFIVTNAFRRPKIFGIQKT